MFMFSIYYLALKAGLLYSLVHAMVKFENLQKHWLFLALLYSAGVFFLSWIWFVAPDEHSNMPKWKIFWLVTTGISIVYFRLLSWFDEGFMFWTLLLLGMVVVYY